MTFDPQAYAPGDIVEVRQTFVVVNVGKCSIEAEDVKSGENVDFHPDDDTMKIRMVKRAVVRPRPKPQAGDVIKGSAVQAVMWKRGTMIRCVEVDRYPAGDLAALVLFTDGKWHDVEGMSAYEFDDLNKDAKFKILLVA